VHWILYDMPATLSALPENLPKQAGVLNGAQQGHVWGVDSFSRVGYFGPCPPPGPAHHYHFKLYALDRALSLGSKANKPRLEKAMEGHILGTATLTGLYGREVS
jgi:Raf kinase inhibitor-like YbhB/YbcL family protein